MQDISDAAEVASRKISNLEKENERLRKEVEALRYAINFLKDIEESNKKIEEWRRQHPIVIV